MKTKIIHTRFEFHHNRTISYGTLVDAKGTVLKQGSLLEILRAVEENDLVIENAQEILNMLIIENGFAS